MLDYLFIFVAGFIAVFALGFQSRNVNSGKVKSAAVTSFLIALSQGTIIVQLAHMADWPSKIVYGLSGSCGIVCAMLTHDRLYRMLDRRKASSGDKS